MNDRYVKDGRLVYLHEQTPERNVWEGNWSEKDIDLFLSLDARMALGEYEQVFLPVIDRAHPVLEAGCGPCRYIHGLRASGYITLGIDNCRPLLAAVKRSAPELSLAAMDVCRFALKDSTIGACISLGVLEHFPAGMETPLAEARRIMRSDGLLIASVPYFNPCRIELMKEGHFQSGEISWERFYQFALTEEDFKNVLIRNGFEPLKTHYLHTIKGMRDEHPWLKRLYDFYRSVNKGGIIKKLVAKVVYPSLQLIEFFADWHWVKKRYSHMVLIVARKA